MRFFENGPSIPDELLVARDEGRVVFFCGAGVSRARAGLSDFFDLADKVIQGLGVPEDSPALNILNEAKELSTRTGVDGLISADRIFGLLERDFYPRDIETEVAKTLQPSTDVDLSAHRILLDLATTQEGKVRLVTTNFDRLFDECKSESKIWQPPRLPDPAQHDDLDGIIHLHGRVNKDYNGSEGEGFILSSSEFGRAYLSDGWATKFFKEIIDRYIVVFVGYSADDPPVHYLLEALNKKEGQLKGVYAFQSGKSDTAAEKWRHKGVEAIAYTDGDHAALWATLEAWALRAKGVDEWYQSVINLAQKGPEKLPSYVRGQVAHVVSSLEGVRKFISSNTKPPAEWLCVFDPYRRYAKPGYSDRSLSQEARINPFDLYGLDSDTKPVKIDPDDHYTNRDVPVGAWSAFVASRLDLQNLKDDSFSCIMGDGAINMPSLPFRLNQLGAWVANVCDQTTTVWWAANQTGLHPSIQRQIKWQLENPQKEISTVIRQAWLYLFESWANKPDENNEDLYRLKALIDKDGWSSSIVRKYAAINRPYFKVEKSFLSGPRAKDNIAGLQISDLISLDVEYPEFSDDLPIPDVWLSAVVCESRKNLESALQLENEIGGYGLNNISPIIPDDDPDNDRYGRTHGLSRHVILFTSYFTKLTKLDASLAQRELATWPTDDDNIFCRLRIWACGQPEIVTAKTFGQIFKDLSDEAFWDSYSQRDLLLVLAKRWKGLHAYTRKAIERRLLKGVGKYDSEDENKYKEYKAWSSLNRIVWLANNGCDFTFDLDKVTKKLQSIAPEWKLQHADKAAESMEGRSGIVRTNTEYSSLLLGSLDSILSKANKLRGKTENFLRENDPFKGLSNDLPVRAFSALIFEAKRHEYPDWAWRSFLYADSRKNDKQKFTALIAERISQFPDGAINSFIHPVSDWIMDRSKELSLSFPESFDKIISKLIHELKLQSSAANSSIMSRNNESDWSSEALNAPVGKIAQAILQDKRTETFKVKKDFSKNWLSHVEGLLSLDGDFRRHAIVTFSRALNWFYFIDNQWTIINLLSILEDGSKSDKVAFWDGFLSSGDPPNIKLYLKIKDHLLAIAKNNGLAKKRNREALARVILVGWGSTIESTNNRFISNSEMRETLLRVDDDFRSRILWLLKRWSKPDNNDKGESWADKLQEFLQDVWPRQISVKSQDASAGLFELVCSNMEDSELLEITLPLLTTIGRNKLHIPYFRSSNDSVAELYPSQFLTLLDKVLPDDVEDWPYNIEDTLKRMSDADSNLKIDERFLKLQRKWSSR